MKLFSRPDKVRVPVWKRAEATGIPPQRPNHHQHRLKRIAFGVPVLALGIAAFFGRYIVLIWALRLLTASPPLLPSLLFVGVTVVLLLWKLPRRQVSRSQGLTAENRFDRE